MKNVLKICLWIILGIAAVILLGWFIYNAAKAKTEEISHPVVTFEFKDYGSVKMELYPEYAPNTVANIIKLVEKGYYTDKVIYGKDEICLYMGRNSEGEAVNPKASLINDSIEVDSENDYEYTINGEFIVNDFAQNTLRHEKGVITLIRNDYSQYFSSLSDESYNSGNAQIGIIMSDNATNLNGVYAGFGKVVEGMDVLEKIYTETAIKPKESETTAETDTTTAETDATTEETAETETTEEDTGGIDEFDNYPVISSATVDTKGIDYGMPEIQEAFDYETYMNNLMQQYYGY